MELSKQERVGVIKTRARALWKKFKGNAFRPGNEEDEIIIQEYVSGCKNIPTHEIVRTFEAASKADKLPRGHELERFKPGQTSNQGGSPTSQSPFSLEFQDWLAEIGSRANVKYCETSGKQYRALYEMADQAHLPRCQFVQKCAGQSTGVSKRLFKEWVSTQGVPPEKLRLVGCVVTA